MFGQTEEKLIGTPLGSLLPRIAEDAVTFDMLLANPDKQGGGIKTSRLGKRNPAERFQGPGQGPPELCVSQALEKANAAHGPRAVLVLQPRGQPHPAPLEVDLGVAGDETKLACRCILPS